MTSTATVTDQFPVTPQAVSGPSRSIATLPGWKCDVRGDTDYDALPAQAKAYVEFLEAKVGRTHHHRLHWPQAPRDCAAQRLSPSKTSTPPPWACPLVLSAPHFPPASIQWEWKERALLFSISHLNHRQVLPCLNFTAHRAPSPTTAGIREAVCIHTRKIYRQTPREKDCVEDLAALSHPEFPGRQGIDRAIGD